MAGRGYLVQAKVEKKKKAAALFSSSNRMHVSRIRILPGLV